MIYVVIRGWGGGGGGYLRLALRVYWKGVLIERLDKVS